MSAIQSSSPVRQDDVSFRNEIALALEASQKIADELKLAAQRKSEVPPAIVIDESEKMGLHNPAVVAVTVPATAASESASSSISSSSSSSVEPSASTVEPKNAAATVVLPPNVQAIIGSLVAVSPSSSSSSVSAATDSVSAEVVASANDKAKVAPVPAFLLQPETHSEIQVSTVAASRSSSAETVAIQVAVSAASSSSSSSFSSSSVAADSASEPLVQVAKKAESQKYSKYHIVEGVIRDGTLQWQHHRARGVENTTDLNTIPEKIKNKILELEKIIDAREAAEMELIAIEASLEKKVNL